MFAREGEAGGAYESGTGEMLFGLAGRGTDTDTDTRKRREKVGGCRVRAGRLRVIGQSHLVVNLRSAEGTTLRLAGLALAPLPRPPACHRKPIALQTHQTMLASESRQLRPVSSSLASESELNLDLKAQHFDHPPASTHQPPRPCLVLVSATARAWSVRLLPGSGVAGEHDRAPRQVDSFRASGGNRLLDLGSVQYSCWAAARVLSSTLNRDTDVHACTPRLLGPTARRPVGRSFLALAQFWS